MRIFRTYVFIYLEISVVFCRMKLVIVKMREKVDHGLFIKKKPQTRLAVKVLHCTMKWKDQFVILRNKILELLYH